MDKIQLSALVALGIHHEAFTHETHGTFDVTLMRQAALAGQYGEPWLSPIDDRTLFIVSKCRDWEKSRILWLIKNGKLDDPALCVDAPDGSQILIDGTHRILGRYATGLREFLWYRASWDQAIRPQPGFVGGLPHMDWGKISIRDGKLFDKETGEPWKVPNPDEQL